MRFKVSSTLEILAEMSHDITELQSRNFNEFLGSVERRGVGAMEIVAMDMKLRGMYIARQLSFQVRLI